MLSIRFTPERTAIRPSPYRNHRFISIRRPGVSVKSIYYFKSKYSNKIIIPIIFDNFFLLPAPRSFRTLPGNGKCILLAYKKIVFTPEICGGTAAGSDCHKNVISSRPRD